MDSNRIKRFLDKIAQLESSSGQNLAHKTMSKGMHRGDTAIGRYGLMPNTIDEFVKRTGMNKELMNMSGEEKRAAIEANPELEQQLASQVAEHVIRNQGGNEEASAYSWLYGHNLDDKQVNKRNYRDSDYVKKFRQLETPPEPIPTQLPDMLSNPQFDTKPPLLPNDILEKTAGMSMEDKSKLYNRLKMR